MKNLVRRFKSVMFDMDGVLIDSEKQWIQTEQRVLSAFGIPATDSQSHNTESMTISEAVRYWHEKVPEKRSSVGEAIQMGIDVRSEERRVGKECRSRRAPDH